MELCHLFLWILVCTSTAETVSCPQNCECSNVTVKCHRTIPAEIPPYINEVFVFETILVGQFNFTGQGWRNVKSLAINPELSTYHDKQAEVYKDLKAFEFEGLNNLEVLQISCRCLRNIEDSAFRGLNNLKVLDLRNNENLRIDSLHKGFIDANVTNLTDINLSNSSHFVPDNLFLQLKPELFEIFKSLPLKVFDISNTEAFAIGVDDYVPEAFPVLEKLNMSASGRLWLPFSYPCRVLEEKATSYQHLRSIDLSYMSIPFEISDDLVTSGLAGQNLYAPPELNEVYFRNIFKNPGRLPPVTANLTHLCFISRTNKTTDNFCYVGKGETLRKMVAAENSVLYFDPNLMDSIPNLQYLDISGNLLGDIISEGLINIMMVKLQRLETLILSKNRIKIIPTDSFATSKHLRHLDLSYNNLESVTFDTKQLLSIRTLNLCYNKISVLDYLSVERLSYFLDMNNTKRFTEWNIVKLTGNPFVCSCDHISGLQWLSRLKDSLICIFETEIHEIDDYTIKNVEYHCKLMFVIATFCIYGMAVITLSAALVYRLKAEYNRYVFHKQIKEAVQKYKARPDKQTFPVFLSFSCEDDEIVMTDIFPNLERGLQNILKTDLPCVATGYNAFRPGQHLAEEIIRCVEASSVVVFFVTNRFCKKSWCRYEKLIAIYENKPIILMMWEEIDFELMPRYMYKHYRNHASVHWVRDEHGHRKIRPGWNELCEVIVSRFTDHADDI